MGNPLHQPGSSDRDWTEDFAYENGNYINTCCADAGGCGLAFWGHKRRHRCKTCAAKASMPHPSPEAVEARTCNGNLQVEIAFLEEASRYFENRPTHDEDRAHWSNVHNAENCRKVISSLTRETARADAAVAEAKALREAAEQAYGYLWVTSAMVPKDDPVSLARKRLLDEIGGWKSAGQRRGIAFATDQFEVGPDGVRPKRATLAQPAADGGK